MKCKTALQVFTIATMLTSCSKYKYNEDNIVEEIVEEGIKHYTGTEIDLSFGEKETGFSPRAFVPLSKREEKEKE